MSLLSTIALAIAAIIGMIIGHPLSKSAGRKEGIQEAKDTQQIDQARAITESIKERNDVETKVAATSRADIDRELREFSSPD